MSMQERYVDMSQRLDAIRDRVQKYRDAELGSARETQKQLEDCIKDINDIANGGRSPKRDVTPPITNFDIPKWLAELSDHGCAEHPAVERMIDEMQKALDDCQRPDAMTREYRDELIEEARSQYAECSGDNIEVDDNAMLSPSDSGCWVQGWLWVSGDEEDDDG